MISLEALKREFGADENDDKKSAILSVEDFQELIENIEDLAAIAERRDEATVSHEKLLEELRNDGII